jgi:hypothetical protein
MEKQSEQAKQRTTETGISRSSKGNQSLDVNGGVCNRRHLLLRLLSLFTTSSVHEMWSLPFIPYPPAKAGFWNPVTSTLNWCEEVCSMVAFWKLDPDSSHAGLLCDSLRRRDCQHSDESHVYVAGHQGYY